LKTVSAGTTFARETIEAHLSPKIQGLPLLLKLTEIVVIVALSEVETNGVLRLSPIPGLPQLSKTIKTTRNARTVMISLIEAEIVMAIIAGMEMIVVEGVEDTVIEEVEEAGVALDVLVIGDHDLMQTFPACLIGVRMML